MKRRATALKFFMLKERTIYSTITGKLLIHSNLVVLKLLVLLGDAICFVSFKMNSWNRISSTMYKLIVVPNVYVESLVWTYVEYSTKTRFMCVCRGDLVNCSFVHHLDGLISLLHLCSYLTSRISVTEESS